MQWLCGADASGAQPPPQAAPVLRDALRGAAARGEGRGAVLPGERGAAGLGDPCRDPGGVRGRGGGGPPAQHAGTEGVPGADDAAGEEGGGEGKGGGRGRKRKRVVDEEVLGCSTEEEEEEEEGSGSERAAEDGEERVAVGKGSKKTVRVQKSVRGASSSGRPLKGTRAWIRMKKELRRIHGEPTRPDTKYTGRKRRRKF